MLIYTLLYISSVLHVYITHYMCSYIHYIHLYARQHAHYIYITLLALIYTRYTLQVRDDALLAFCAEAALARPPSSFDMQAIANMVRERGRER